MTIIKTLERPGGWITDTHRTTGSATVRCCHKSWPEGANFGDGPNDACRACIDRTAAFTELADQGNASDGCVLCHPDGGHTHRGPHIQRFGSVFPR